jgi:small subunit ribosomal protein S6
LISDQVPESDLNKITGKVGGFITDLGGKITKEEIWGRRKLAYPIKRQDFATYVTLMFSLPGLAVKEFDREIRLTDKILRHLLIVKEMGKEDMSLTREEIAETAAIEEVVGGEKSFEAIEGETEESKDLMAKRETETEEPKEEVKEEAEVKAEAKEEEKAEKPAKKAPAKKKESADEADRLNKLNEELDDILKDEL